LQQQPWMAGSCWTGWRYSLFSRMVFACALDTLVHLSASSLLVALALALSFTCTGSAGMGERKFECSQNVSGVYIR
jgi:hypothetical protein